MNPDTTRQKALARLAPVPKEYAEAWARAAESSIEDRMRRALLRIVYGSTCREAAREEGYASHQDVARAARRFGILDASKARLINGARRVAQLSQDELEERLTAQPEAIGSKDLAIIAGIAIDKVARAERWDQQEPERPSYAEAVLREAERIVASGVVLELRLSPASPDHRPSEPEPIDVTPTKRQGDDP